MLHLAPAAMADIRSAAQAGLTITTHEKRLHINGYTGEDISSSMIWGDGAYLINGGLYGAALLLIFGSTLMLSLAIWATTNPLVSKVMGKDVLKHVTEIAVALQVTAISLILKQKRICEASWRFARGRMFSLTSKMFKGVKASDILFWIGVLFDVKLLQNPCEYIK